MEKKDKQFYRSFATTVSQLKICNSYRREILKCFEVL